jgi:hypothetical protein
MQLLWNPPACLVHHPRADVDSHFDAIRFMVPACDADTLVRRLSDAALLGMRELFYYAPTRPQNLSPSTVYESLANGCPDPKRFQRRSCAAGLRGPRRALAQASTNESKVGSIVGTAPCCICCCCCLSSGPVGLHNGGDRSRDHTTSGVGSSVCVETGCGSAPASPKSSRTAPTGTFVTSDWRKVPRSGCRDAAVLPVSWAGSL